MKFIYTFADSSNETYRVNIVLEDGDDKSEVIIPDSYNGKKVTHLTSKMFDEFGADLKTIVFGDNIHMIYPITLFAKCTGLETIYLGKNITASLANIDTCPNLKNVFFNGTKEEWEAKKENGNFKKLEDFDVRCGTMYNKVQLKQDDKAVFPITHWDCVKGKPENFEFGGQVQADFLETDESKASFIKNKPAVDTQPVKSSTNLISSGAVFDAIGGISVPVYDSRKFKDIEEEIPEYITWHDMKEAVRGEVVMHDGSDSFDEYEHQYLKVTSLPGNPNDILEEILYLFSVSDGENITPESTIIKDDYIGIYRENDLIRTAWHIFLVKSSNTTHNDNYYNIVFPEPGIYICYDLFNIEEAGGVVYSPTITKIKFKGEVKKLENEFLYVDEIPKEDSKSLITSGAVYKVKEEVQNNKAEIDDLKSKSEDAENQIKDLNEFKENTETSINKLEEAVEENESDIETLQTKVSEMQKKQCIVSVDSFPMEAKNNDIVALVNDTETSQIDKVVEVKTREELSTTDEDGTINVNLSGATLVKNIKIEGLPTDYDSLDGDIWSPYDFLENAESATIKVGIGIYDKLWKNGMKIIFTDTKFDALPHIEVVKVEDGIETSTYYYLFASIPLNEDNSLMIEESGWYKLVGDSYEKLSEDELSSVTQEFDEAYIVDYWTTENENEYNDAIEQGLNIKSPMAISVLISHFITLFVKKGLYKFDGSKWSEWALSSGTSNTENFATKDEVNSLLDSFAAMLDAANREVI